MFTRQKSRIKINFIHIIVIFREILKMLVYSLQRQVQQLQPIISTQNHYNFQFEPGQKILKNR
jgi:hypothetical protein